MFFLQRSLNIKEFKQVLLVRSEDLSAVLPPLRKYFLYLRGPLGTRGKTTSPDKFLPALSKILYQVKNSKNFTNDLKIATGIIQKGK